MAGGAKKCGRNKEKAKKYKHSGQEELNKTRKALKELKKSEKRKHRAEVREKAPQNGKANGRLGKQVV